MRTWRGRPDVSAFDGIDLFEAYRSRVLAPLALHADRVVVLPGAALAREGGYAREVVIVVAGEVTVVRGGADVGRLGPGDVVGAFEEMSGTAHDATYLARTAVSAVVLTVPAFRWAMGSLPRFADRVVDRFADRVVGRSDPHRVPHGLGLEEREHAVEARVGTPVDLA
jgi:CRP/FNR family cyclic AMP-dependent transcriptional regulator